MAYVPEEEGKRFFEEQKAVFNRLSTFPFFSLSIPEEPDTLQPET